MSVYVPAGPPKQFTATSGQLVLAADIPAPATPGTLISSGSVPAGRYLITAKAVITGSTTPSIFSLFLAGMTGCNKWVPDANPYSLFCSYIYYFSVPTAIWLQVAGPTGATVKRLEVVNNVLAATLLNWVQINNA